MIDDVVVNQKLREKRIKVKVKAKAVIDEIVNRSCRRG